MYISTLQCGHLLWLDRYLNDFQAFATCLSACDVVLLPGPLDLRI
jgi:hypothetical protein